MKENKDKKLIACYKFLEAFRIAHYENRPLGYIRSILTDVENRVMMMRLGVELFAEVPLKEIEEETERLINGAHPKDVGDGK